MNFANIMAADGNGGIGNYVLFGILALLVIAVFVIPMFTNKKRQKEIDKLHDSVTVGATVKTVGGVIGKVIAVREISPADKEMVIETGEGDNKCTMVFDMMALYQVLQQGEKVYEETPVYETASESEAAAETVGADESTAAAETAVENIAETDSAVSAEDATTEDASETAAEAAPEINASEETAQADENKAAVTPSANSSKKTSSKRKR